MNRIKMKTETQDLGEVKIAYREAGSGPAGCGERGFVLYCRGFCSFDWWSGGENFSAKEATDHGHLS